MNIVLLYLILQLGPDMVGQVHPVTYESVAECTKAARKMGDTVVASACVRGFKL